MKRTSIVEEKDHFWDAKWLLYKEAFFFFLFRQSITFLSAVKFASENLVSNLGDPKTNLKKKKDMS